MTKLVEITKCSDCPNCYYNYSPTGLQSDGKSWCSKSDKQLDLQKQFTEIPEWCELPDTIALGCSHNKSDY